MLRFLFDWSGLYSIPLIYHSSLHFPSLEQLSLLKVPHILGSFNLVLLRLFYSFLHWVSGRICKRFAVLTLNRITFDKLTHLRLPDLQCWIFFSAKRPRKCKFTFKNCSITGQTSGTSIYHQCILLADPVLVLWRASSKCHKMLIRDSKFSC